MSSLKPFEEKPPSADWRLIFATGFFGFVLVLLVGMSVALADELLAEDTPIPPMATPDRSPTIALQIPHVGRWHFTMRDGAEIVCATTGTGEEFTRPDCDDGAELPVTGAFEITWTYPFNLDDTQIETHLTTYTDENVYLLAVSQTFYALYNAEGQWLRNTDQLPIGVPVEVWRPSVGE